MRMFETREMRDAIRHALNGGQALHLHGFIPDPKRAPKCFVTALRRGERIAHLFDQDEARLKGTLKRLGVRRIRIERRDSPYQHADLCGTPLSLAMNECENAID